jgi:hypothetical protein
MNAKDTSLEAERVLIDIIQRMPPDVKFNRIFDAYHLGKVLAMAGLRDLHPQATSQQIWILWARQHLGDTLFQEAYGALPIG